MLVKYGISMHFGPIHRAKMHALDRVEQRIVIVIVNHDEGRSCSMLIANAVCSFCLLLCSMSEL